METERSEANWLGFHIQQHICCTTVAGIEINKGAVRRPIFNRFLKTNNISFKLSKHEHKTDAVLTFFMIPWTWIKRGT